MINPNVVTDSKSHIQGDFREYKRALLKTKTEATSQILIDAMNSAAFLRQKILNVKQEETHLVA